VSQHPRRITVILPRAAHSLKAAIRQARRKAQRMLDRRRWAQLEIDWTPHLTFWPGVVRYVFEAAAIYGPAYTLGRRTRYSTPEDEGFSRPSWQRECIDAGRAVWDWDDVCYPEDFAPANWP